MASILSNTPESVGSAMLMAFEKSLVDNLTQIGINAIRPQIEAQAKLVVGELKTKAEGFYDPAVRRSIINLIINGKVSSDT